MVDANKQSLPVGLYQVNRTSNPNRPVLYVNNSLIVVNQWDAQMYFSLIQETSPGQFGSIEQALVVMTPEHALAFSKALQQSLEGYEKSQGRIRVIKPTEAPIPAATRKD